ncbi:MAG: response regulator transcription factor [Planctomycetota bacterium]|nr:response regulator transcription factor [Planctomycetota bacterium]
MTRNGTVFLADDDQALCAATTRLLDACGFKVRWYSSAESFLARFDKHEPGCLLLDLRMPGRSGLELQQALADQKVEIPIVFLTGHADVPTSVFAMKKGAVDFLQKPASEEELIAALERALTRDAEQRKTSAELSGLRTRYDTLTPREKEVLAEVVAGQRNKQAAFSLGIAERTVKLHRSRVLEKMGADSLADLVRMAEYLGLGPPRE